MSHNVLIIEDDRDISHLIALHLKDLSFQVDAAADGIQGLSMAQKGNYDLVILDLMLPKLDGLEICKRLRSESNQTPILMLTAKSTELDRVIGLELGADDYLSKPFSILELIARVKAILRRASIRSTSNPVSAADKIRVNGLSIDPARHEVMIDGVSIDLTAREFDLLYYFARNPGRVLSRAQLLDQVWGYGHDGYEHTVNSHINRLRKKIEHDPEHASYILTVWGVGYKFTEPRAGQE